ncbi:hypothetical protein CWI38_0329p0030 [Hamiltosporidium tvaerminnensis]|uniref:Uncharacterized protein n=1 Tax=Hamiltosporidium tvaerminnensis TaxID=1176355 RepID=A0A4Q9LY90_9MICR|nr:hypothetical protein CWI38_0329p0030 [Hamiltosporidium tvaerminnensis]
MRNKNDDTVTYNDYLIPFVSDNHPTMFSSLNEFLNINCQSLECLTSTMLTTNYVTKVVDLEGEKPKVACRKSIKVVRVLSSMSLNEEYDIIRMRPGNNSKQEKSYTKRLNKDTARKESVTIVVCVVYGFVEPHPKLEIDNDADFNTHNHLLFIEKFKLLGIDSFTWTIIEDSRGIPTRSSFMNERYFHTKFNAINLFSAINQHAISLINYHIRVIRLEPPDFSKLDDALYELHVKNNVHAFPEEECQIVLILLRIHASVSFGLPRKSKEISTRQAAILNVENTNKTHLALIKDFLKVKFRLEEEDRSVFRGADRLCQHRVKSSKILDHLVTRCEKTLGLEHKRRHNEKPSFSSRNFENEMLSRFLQQEENTIIIPKRLEMTINEKATTQYIVLKKTFLEGMSICVIKRAKIEETSKLPSLQASNRKTVLKW